MASDFDDLLAANRAFADTFDLSGFDGVAHAGIAIITCMDSRIDPLGMLGLKPGAFGQKITVNSPISGKILEMSVAAGEYRNDTNTPVMTIADLSTVWVSSDVAESAIQLQLCGAVVGELDEFLVGRHHRILRCRPRVYFPAKNV